MHVAAQVERTSCLGHAGRRLVDPGLGLEHLADEVGDRLDRLEHGQAVGEREVAQPAQVEGEHGQDGDLGRERLGAGDADLGAGVQVDPAVGLAGDGAAHRVHDRQGGMSPPPRLAECAQRVGGLSRLAEDEDQGAVVERGVAIAELAGVLDLDREVGQPLDQVLADHGRVPARAAGREDDPADPAELAGGEVQAAELRGRLGSAQPAPAGVAHRLGLLADLLEHVMRVAAQLHGVGLPVDPVDSRRDRPVLAVADLEVVGGEPNDLAVLEVGHPGGVGRDRHRVAGQQVLAIADADHQRAAEPCTDDLTGMTVAEDGQPVRPLEPGEGPLDRLERLVEPFQLAGDQVRDDLRVGLALEDEPLRLQLAPQHRVVLDHAIVHDGHARSRAAAAEVRMGVAVRRRAVGRPSRVADPALAGQGALLELLLQRANPAGTLPDSRRPSSSSAIPALS